MWAPGCLRPTADAGGSDQRHSRAESAPGGDTLATRGADPRGGVQGALGMCCAGAWAWPPSTSASAAAA